MADRRFSLRFTLATLVVGLLVLTVVGVITVAMLIRQRTVAATARTLQNEISARITEKIQERFGPLGRMLSEASIAAKRGVLPVDDDDKLVGRFAERVRYDERIEWVAWLRADGSGSAALRRPGGEILAVIKGPGSAGFASVEVVHADGTRTPAPENAIGDVGGVQNISWFELGADAREPTWTPPYVRPIDGDVGRACVLGVREDDELRGVFGLGFGVGFMREYLQSIRVGESGRVFTVHPEQGQILSSPSEDDLATLGPAVEEAVARLPGGAAGLVSGELESIRVRRGGVAYQIGIERQQVPNLPPWVHVVVIPEDELVGFLSGYLWGGLAAVAVLLLLAIVVAQLLARRVSRPLRVIAGELERVGAFELSGPPAPPSHIREIAVVGDSVDRMKASLRSFGRYVPTDVVRDLVKGGQEAKLGGIERELTLFFSDVQGFTSASEGMMPAALVDALGDYLDVVTVAVRDQQGTIDKFIGDGVLAFFNAPQPDPDHVGHACRAALNLQSGLDEAVPRWVDMGRPAFITRVGLHTAEVVVGNIGTPERFGYTVIGDGVNFAARLESLNKAYGTRILVSQEVKDAAGDDFVWRHVDRTAVSGREAGGDVFELLGTVESVGEGILAARDRYEEALRAYLERRFEEAAALFDEAGRLRPGDKAATVLAARAREYAKAPPADDWTGVYVQTSK